MLSLGLVASFLALAGCSATRQSNVVVVPGKLVPAGVKVFVLAVPDGQRRRAGVAAGSGLASAVALRDALFANGFPPLLGDTSDLDAGLAEAGRLGYDYLVRGTLVQWEDHATQWNLNPDIATLSVALYDVARRELVATSTHTVEGSPGDYRARTTDRFVAELADHCLGTLFGWTPTVVTAR
jgi:hypothetical protein